MDIQYCEDAQGNSSIKTLIQDLERRAQSNKQARIQLKQVLCYVEYLEARGTRIGLPVTEYIRDGIWQLRPGSYRVLFFVWHGQAVLLHAYRKRTNGTPAREIDVAKRLIADWTRQFGP